MDVEKIAKFIKNVRLKQNLSQREFALKYGVTYQAVSKWENGKNLPDISILRQICKENNVNLDDIFDDKINSNNYNKIKNKWFLGGLIGIILIVVLSLFFINSKKNNDFQFKTLSSKCDNFKLYGSLAYNDNKASIYIPSISYCGKNDDTKYKKLDCGLYESDGDNIVKISDYNYSDTNGITIKKFLSNVTFNVSHYERVCKIYKENSLYLEIRAYDNDGKATSYKIPLKAIDNCNK